MIPPTKWGEAALDGDTSWQADSFAATRHYRSVRMHSLTVPPHALHVLHCTPNPESIHSRSILRTSPSDKLANSPNGSNRNPDPHSSPLRCPAAGVLDCRTGVLGFCVQPALAVHRHATSSRDAPRLQRNTAPSLQLGPVGRRGCRAAGGRPVAAPHCARRTRTLLFSGSIRLESGRHAIHGDDDLIPPHATYRPRHAMYSSRRLRASIDCAPVRRPHVRETHVRQTMRRLRPALFILTVPPAPNSRGHDAAGPRHVRAASSE